MSGVLRSVLGVMDVNDLGVTMSHEHALVDLSCYWSPSDDQQIADRKLELPILGRTRAAPFACRDNLYLDERLATIELTAFAESGGLSVIDLTGSEAIGRNPQALERLSRTTGVTIVAATGFYLEATVPQPVLSWSIDQIVEHYTRELSEGIGDSGICAGVVGEIGIGSHPMTPWEERALAASLQTGESTGKPVFIHPGHGHASVMEIARAVLDEGINPARVVLCHMDARMIDAISDLIRLAEEGFYIGFDTFGRELYYRTIAAQLPQDQTRLRALRQLGEAGVTDRVLLSQDVCFKHETLTWGGHGLVHILDSIIPRLEAVGIDEQLFISLLIDNPARLFFDAA